jgi:hypothetical protein
MHRRELKGAPYNPREITEDARRRLEKFIRTEGLLEPICWNKRTGFVVGGHQRLAVLDALEGSDDYLLDVSVVDKSDKSEKKANIFLNSGDAQGTFLPDLLAPLLVDINDDGAKALEEAGISAGWAEAMFGGTEWEATFFPDIEAAALPPADEETSHAPVAPGAPPKPTPAELAKQHRSEMRADHADNVNTDIETYTTVVFMHREEAEAFAMFFDAPPERKMLDGRLVLAKLGIELPKRVKQ